MRRRGAGRDGHALLDRLALRAPHAAPDRRAPGGRAARTAAAGVLHGRGSGPGSNLNDAFVSALAAQGSRAPAVVFPSGGDHSYWHRRRGGDWARYVLREVIPEAVRRLNADPDRIAIGGISMGGYGAFEIARKRRFCAVGGHSAATWLTSGASAPVPGLGHHVRPRTRDPHAGLARRPRLSLLGPPLPRLPALLRPRAGSLLGAFVRGPDASGRRVLSENGTRHGDFEIHVAVPRAGFPACRRSSPRPAAPFSATHRSGVYTTSATPSARR